MEASQATATAPLSAGRHLLVDLENVQPTAASVDTWIGSGGKAWVFHGPQQRKLLPAFESLGDRVTVVPITRVGHNALDFHLVFYLGYLAARSPAGSFTVLSKDTGFDPPLAHARSLKFEARRIASLEAAPVKAAKRPTKPAVKKVVKKAAAKQAAQKVAAKKAAGTAVVTVARKAAVSVAAKSAGAATPPTATAAIGKPHAIALDAAYRTVRAQLDQPNRPRTLAALQRHLVSLLSPEGTQDDVQQLLDRLRTVDAIDIVDGVLRYTRPAASA